MVDWQRTLRLNPLWDKSKDEETPASICELARYISQNLKMMPSFSDSDVSPECQWNAEDLNEERLRLSQEFELIAEDNYEDYEEACADFNAFMEELYDWGDLQIGGKFFNAKKVCFIDTFSA